MDFMYDIAVLESLDEIGEPAADNARRIVSSHFDRIMQDRGFEHDDFGFPDDPVNVSSDTTTESNANADAQGGGTSVSITLGPK